VATPDEFFDEDFAGDWTPLEPFDCPSVTELPPAAINIIGRRLHVDMSDANPLLLGEKMAANEWFWRRRAGQRVTFTQVVRGGTAFPRDESGDDPKEPAGSAS
jgi:hypothetical protein